MKSLPSLIVFFFLILHSSKGQHPFNDLNKIEDKSELIGKVINALEYTVLSPNMESKELREIVSNSTLLAKNEKAALLLLIDAEDKSIKDKKSTIQYFEQSIDIIADSLSSLEAYVRIKKGGNMAYQLQEGYVSEVENLSVYRSDDYPEWLRGYLYATLSMYALQQQDYDHFISYADTASIMLEKNNHFAKQGQLYHTVGNELFVRGIDTASVYLEKALDVELEHDLDYLRMRTLTMIAGVDRFAEDYEACLDKQYQVIHLAEELKDTSFIIEGWMRLSVTMSAQGGKQLVKAVEILKKAQALAYQVGDDSRYGRSIGYLGSAYINMEDYRLAISAIKKSIELNGEKNKDNLIPSYLELAICYKELGDTDSTYIAVMQSNKYNGGRNPSYGQYGEMILTDYYIEKKQFEKATEGANLGLEMAGDYDKSMKAVALNQLRAINEAQGNYKKAYEYFVEVNDVEYLIKNEDLSTQITEARLEATYDAEKKIILANGEKEKAIIEARQKRLMYLASIAALIAAFLGGLYFLLRSKNKEINLKNNELEKLNNVKDQLFQIIGHDLRKPSLAFRNVSKNLNYLIEKGDVDRIKLLGKEIDQEGKNLYNLTDNLLHWALMQKDLLSISPANINVHQTVAENIELFQSVAKNKNITLLNHVDEDMNVYADRNSMDTIIRNLIDNALKYSSDGGTIKLHVTENGSLIDLFVTDDGIGMTPQKVDEILNEKLTESKVGTANESGSGLGLKIIRSMVAKNDGYIKVNSTKGSGSTFIVSLPMAS